MYVCMCVCMYNIHMYKYDVCILYRGPAVCEQALHHVPYVSHGARYIIPVCVFLSSLTLCHFIFY